MSVATLPAKSVKSSKEITPSAPPVMPGDRVFQSAATVFGLLQDKTRLQLLWLMRQRPGLNVAGLCEAVGMTQPAISHHLALLRVADLVDARHEGKCNYYSISRAGKPVVDFVLKVIG